MGKFVKGDVIVVPFPFSDLSASKKRPALVIAALTGDDVLLCQITSQAISDSYAIPLTNTDFISGGSLVRPAPIVAAPANPILLSGDGAARPSTRHRAATCADPV